MKNIITDINLYIKHFRENKTEINNLLYKEYGIYPNKIELLKENEKEMLQLPITKSIILNDFLEKLENGQDLDVDMEDIEESFLLNTNSNFFEVLDYEDDKISLAKIENDFIEGYQTTRDLEVDSKDIIFGFTYKDGETNHLLENFVILNEEEIEKIYEVFSDYYVENELDLYFESVIVHRMMDIYMESVDLVLKKHKEVLTTRFEEESLYNFFKHIGNIAKYSFSSQESVDIFNINYFDFLIKESEDGNFVVEGELENFLEILEFLVSKEEDVSEETLDSIKYTFNNIFKIKNNILKNNPITQMNLVMGIDDLLDITTESVLEISGLGFFIETLFELENVKITEKTRKLSTKSMRNYVKTYFSGSLNEDNTIDPKMKNLLDLSVSIILGNNLGDTNSENELYSKSRYNFFLSNIPSEFIANLITGIFRIETLEYYIGKKNLDYEKLLEALKETIVSKEFYKLEDTQEGNKLLEILQVTGIISKHYLNDYSHYKLSLLGQFLKERFEKNKEGGKVLNLIPNKD